MSMTADYSRDCLCDFGQLNFRGHQLNFYSHQPNFRNAQMSFRDHQLKSVTISLIL
jgi:hypothetical protein